MLRVSVHTGLMIDTGANDSEVSDMKGLYTTRLLFLWFNNLVTILFGFNDVYSIFTKNVTANCHHESIIRERKSSESPSSQKGDSVDALNPAGFTAPLITGTVCGLALSFEWLLILFHPNSKDPLRTLF